MHFDCVTNPDQFMNDLIKLNDQEQIQKYQFVWANTVYGPFWWLIDIIIASIHIVTIAILVTPLFLVLYLITVFRSLFTIFDERYRTNDDTLLY